MKEFLKRQSCGEASADAEVFAGLGAEPAVLAGFKLALETIAAFDGRIVSGSPGPLYSAGFSAGVGHMSSIAKAALGSVPMWAGRSTLPAPPAARADWALVPREPTPDMLAAARLAELAPGKDDGWPVWDNWGVPSTADKETWEAALPGITAGSFHASYEWPEWIENVLRVCYRAMLGAAPASPTGGQLGPGKDHQATHLPQPIREDQP